MDDRRTESRKASTSSGTSLPPAVPASRSPSPPSSLTSSDTPRSVATQRQKSSTSAETKKCGEFFPTTVNGPLEKSAVHKLSYQVERNSPPINNRRQSLQLPLLRTSAQITSGVPDGLRLRKETKQELPETSEEPQNLPPRRRSSTASLQRLKKSSIASPRPYTFLLESDTREAILSNENLQKTSVDEDRAEPILEKRRSSDILSEKVDSPAELPSNRPPEIDSEMWKQSNVHVPGDLKCQKLMENPPDYGSDDEQQFASLMNLKDGRSSVQKDGGLRESRSSSVSRRPYNVIFESDEAVSESTVEGKKAPRGSRENLEKFAPSTGERDSGIGGSVLLALKNWTAGDDDGLQKILDVWYAQLRQALLAENATAREKIIAEFDRSTRELVKSQQQGTERMHGDIDSLHNLCRSYSKAIHERDRTIANLAEALASQKEQVAVARSMVVARNVAEDNRREVLLNQVADRFYRKKVVQVAWSVWRSALQDRTRERIERACKKRAEEVCHQMADKYDAKIASLEETIRRLRQENRMHKEERNRMSSNARDALMHGVTVLNEEAKRFPDVNDDSSEKTVSRKQSGSRGGGSRTSSDIPQSRSRGSGDSGQRPPVEVPKRRGQSVGSGPLPYKIIKHQQADKNKSSDASRGGSSDRTSSRDDR